MRGLITRARKLEFRLLGPLEVRDDHGVIPAGPPQQRALLAVLLLNANEVVSRDRLVDELWGDQPPETAAKLVQVYVSRLRKALEGDRSASGNEVLVTQAPGYVLRVAPDEVDVHRFERLIEDGRAALAAGAAADAADRLREALEMWRGPPLGDLAFEPFAQSEIGRLEELRLAAVEDRIEAELALGRSDLVGELEALISRHPLRERLRGQLMVALYRSGRQAEALDAYRETRRVLVDELGIEPGKALRELEQRILSQDPALDRVADSAPGAAEQSGSVFVGREAELADLLGGLDDAIAGHGRVFLLGGEPGVGKSRLAEELIRHARERGAHVLVGRCWEAGGAPAYWPWVQALRGYVREAEPEALQAQLGVGATDIAQLLPELRQQFPDLAEPPALEAEGARFRLFDATSGFLSRAGESRPIVLVLDDLHAADTPSLLLLRFLARELGSARVLLLGAYRDVDPLPGPALAEMLAEVAREPLARRLALRGLSKSEVGEYIELTAADIASPELVAGLHGRTEGNPLFVSEIVRLVSLEGVPAESSGDLRLAIPPGVRDVIARRLTHLSPECNEVLLLASVLGREFTLPTLAGLGGISEDELLDLLDEAVAVGVVSDVPGGPGRLRFAHALIRDTLYDGLTSVRRVRLHGQVVQALQALYAADPGPGLAELAHHSIAGRDFDQGLRYARQAGDRALALLAYEEAARLYEMALEALEIADLEDEKTRCELLLSLGEAEGRAGNPPGAKAASLEAVQIARRLGLPRELARGAAGYGGVFSWNRAGDDATLVALLEEGLAELSDEDVELRARLLARLAGALRDEPSRARRDELSREAVELARRTGDPAALAHALNGRAGAIGGPDTVPECLALGSELREVAEQIGDMERMLDGHFIQIIAHQQAGAVAEAERELAAAGRLAEELRQPTQLWEVAAARAISALCAGRLAEAEELSEQAVALGRRAQPAEAIPVYRLQLYALGDLRGDLEAVEAAISETAAEYPARPVFRCAVAHLHARLGRPSEAKRTLDDLAADNFSALPFDQEWLLGVSLLAETSALLNDTESAPVLYRLLLPWAAFNAADYPEGSRGSISRYLGLLATTTERWSAGARHFGDALKMNERMGARSWLALSQHDYAEMLLARGEPGDREQALALARDALHAYRGFGMAPYASEAAQLERALSAALAH